MPTRSERTIHLSGWAVALVFGLFQAWVHRLSMSIDGVSYVDIAVNLSQRDWGDAVTGHWSPLFPAMMAVVLAIVRPSAIWEFQVVHVFELVLYVGTLAAFTLLLAELLPLRDRDSVERDGSTLSRALLLVLGYSTFIWTTLALITVYAVTPDLLLAGLLYLAAAMLVRIRRGAAGTGTWLVLGIALGLGYLAKTVLLVLAPAFLAAAYLAAPDRRAVRRPLALATIVWLTVSIPWIALLSSEKDRLTLGDTARDTYVWEVGNLPYRHWQGEEPGFGEPVHPTRLIHPDPPVYEFGEPVAGTYPIWYDPSYWYEGVRMRFSLRRQVLAVLRSLLVYLPVVDAFLLSWLVLFIAGVRRRSDLRRPFADYGFLLFPAMFALLLYSVVHVQQRYIAGFWTLAILALMLGLRLPRSDMTPRVFRGAVLATVFVLGARLCMLAVADVRLALDPPVDWQRSGAAGLRRMGVQPGESVAWIGGTLNPVWARLARVRIIAEIPVENVEQYWSADAATRNEVLALFAAEGADVVYASGVPPLAPTEGWTDLGLTRFARRLQGPDSLRTRASR